MTTTKKNGNSNNKFDELIDNTVEYRRSYLVERQKPFELRVIEERGHLCNQMLKMKYRDEVLKPLRVEHAQDLTFIEHLFRVAESELLQLKPNCSRVFSVDYFDTLKYVCEMGSNGKLTDNSFNVAYLTRCVCVANYVDVDRVRERLFEKLLSLKLNSNAMRANFNDYLDDLIENATVELRELKKSIREVFDQCLDNVVSEAFFNSKLKCILLNPAQFLSQHFESLELFFYERMFQCSFSLNLALLNKHKSECVGQICKKSELFRIEVYKYFYENQKCSGIFHLVYLLIKNHLLLNKFILVDRDYNIKSITTDHSPLNYYLPYFDRFVKLLDPAKLYFYEEKYLNLNIIKPNNEMTLLSSPALALSKPNVLCVENCAHDRILLKYVEICVDFYFDDSLAESYESFTASEKTFIQLKLSSASSLPDPAETLGFERLVRALNEKLRMLLISIESRQSINEL